jgi:hypothetical protein
MNVSHTGAVTPSHVIAFAPSGRYDAPQRERAGSVIRAETAELERRLRAGEWLTPGEVAKLLGLSRTKVHYLIVDGVIGAANKPHSAHRTCDPAHVLRELAQLRASRDAAGRTPPDPEADETP